MLWGGTSRASSDGRGRCDFERHALRSGLRDVPPVPVLHSRSSCVGVAWFATRAAAHLFSDLFYRSRNSRLPPLRTGGVRICAGPPGLRPEGAMPNACVLRVGRFVATVLVVVSTCGAPV